MAVSRLVMDCVEDDPAERPRNMMQISQRLDVIIHSLLGDKLKNKNAAKSNQAAE
jgi:hypothetical protein